MNTANSEGKNQDKDFPQGERLRVKKTAFVGLAFGIVLCIIAVVFSPGFVEKYFITGDTMDSITLRLILRGRLLSALIGLILTGLCSFLLYRPDWILVKLAAIGKKGKALAAHLPPLQKNYRKIAVLIIALFCCIAVLYILVGEVNEDEGWYLYAGKLVYQGNIPYSDFSYTQTPLLPYIYGGLQKLFGTSLLLGRITTGIFGLVALVLTMAVAKILSGERASLLAGAAIAVNPFVIYFMIITKTYSLSVMLITLSLLLVFKKGHERFNYPLSVACLAIAVGVRLTVLPVLVLTLIYIAIVKRKYLLRSATTSSLILASIFLPFIILDPKAAYFNVLGYHLARYNPQTPAELILGKIRALFELLIKFPFLLPFIFLGISFFLVPRINCLWVSSKKDIRNYWPHLLVFSSFASVFLIHFVPGGSLPEYQVLNIPLAAIFAGWLFDEWSLDIKKSYKKSLLAMLVIGLLLFSFVGARPIHRVLDPRTSYINLSGNRLPVHEVSEVGRFVKEHTTPDQLLFTTHTFLALEANRNVLEGMEMGIFSFYPEWSTKKAKRYEVVNFEILKEYIRSRSAKALIITDTDFIHSGIYETTGSGIRESLLELIEDNYHREFSMDNFGQFGQGYDKVHVYLRKSY